MRIFLRRGLIAVAVALVLGYAGLCAYIYAVQDKLMYPGGTTDVSLLPAPDSVGLADFRAVTLDTPDGEHLKAWWLPPQPGHGAVLYLHGNGSNGTDPRRLVRFHDLHDAGYGVLAVEYRGFSGSTGHPSEPGLITDGVTGYDYIAKEAPGAKIALFGDSLGTAVALAVAIRRPVAGVLLDSPFASMRRMGEQRYPYLPVGQLATSPWESERRIAEVTTPILVVHCDADRTVPLAEGKRLFDAANQPKDMIVLPGCGHIETWVDPVKSAALIDFATWIGGN